MNSIKVDNATPRKAAIIVSIAPVESPHFIKDLWCELESRSDRTFFLSWAWTGTWLATIDAQPWLATFKQGEEVIGLGFFVPTLKKRHKVLRSKQLHLNATGDAEFDAITIEYNNFLIAKEREAEVWGAFFDYMEKQQAIAWDEIIIPGATEKLKTGLPDSRHSVLVLSEAGSMYVDLDQLRSDGIATTDDFVSTLGKNTRSQIRRSLKLYRERGDITLVRADNAQTAWTFLQEAAPHHARRWETRGGIGAFNRPGYVKFHKSLVESHYDTGVLEVIRIQAGEKAFAWLYNFVDRGTVYFYLCAFDFEEDNRLKPGLVSHALCIGDYLQTGARKYDFMGGDNRYKSSLGQPGDNILSLAVQRSRPKFVIENKLRELKHLLER